MYACLFPLFSSHKSFTAVTMPFSLTCSIDWAYIPQEQSYTVNDYEAMHTGLRRSENELVIPRLIREHILLHEWNVAQADVAMAVRDVIRTKNQRRQTIHHEKTGWVHVDRALQSSGLALRAVLGLRPAEVDKVFELTAPRELVTHAVVQSDADIVKSDVEIADFNGSRDSNSVQWNPLQDDFKYARFYPPPVPGGRSNLVLKHTAPKAIEKKLDSFAKLTLNSATLRPTPPRMDDETDLASLAKKLSSNETLPRHAQLDASLHSTRGNWKTRASATNQKPMDARAWVPKDEPLEHPKYKYNAGNSRYVYQDCFPDDVSEVTFGTARH
jgi:hypothetical protein